MIKHAVFGRAAALAILLSGAMTMSAHAQEVSDAQIAAARDAIAALKATDLYDNILPTVAERLKGQFIQASPNYQTQISSVVDAQALALAPRRADLEKEAATIYAKSFTTEELKAISTFFNTETGKKLLTNQPLVSRELGKAVQIWANGISRDLTNQSTAKLKGIIDSTPVQAPVADPAPAEPAATPAPAKPATQKPAAPAAGKQPSAPLKLTVPPAPKP
ncbi:DUF2059 domain-containing protein [Neorhizobium lilium]|uniref:DUF2059 domain-containing protein n=1 Tax=Neorhizobium lilium TaxID=2503024 RepID=A0A444LCU0_9HYPH|nr:DUF2059 domain-containing protein [Neorhizobium lilium]RWX75514.1 DUF2059 domain-containing protein [Neorhizobium lilium]